MDLLKLHTPQQTPNSGVAAYLKTAKLRVWLDGLPLANPWKTGQGILETLKKVNRTTVPAAQRFHFLELCRPLVASVTEVLYKQYATASIPLDDKNWPSADLAHSLLTEMAFGYKAIMLETADIKITDANRTMLIASSLYAMHHLTKLLVDIYALYLPEPESLWLELHQIYRYAEYEEFSASTFPEDGGKTGVRSINHTYRRILMLALADPYHLMQGEAQLVFRELDKWAVNCQVLSLAAGASPSNQFYVDLESDAPPSYALSRGKTLYPGDGRILDITGILTSLERRVKELLISSKSESGQLNLEGRKLRNMYKRLSEAWGVRVERLSERKPHSNPVEIAIGISAAHHFASHGARFTPESDEIVLHNRKTAGKGRELSLYAENDAPWIDDDQAKRLATGIVQPRTSHFSTDPVKEKDIWVKIYSSKVHYEHVKGTKESTFDSTSCQLLDESRGGMAMSCQKGQDVRIVVGEVIAFKSDYAPNAEDWSIGVVRWLRSSLQKKLELGIGLLADDTLPVATRGVKGAGKDSEYFRSLLIPKLDPTQYPMTLIAPAAVYDVDSIIFFNTGNDIFYAQLTKLIEATNSFSLFQFKIVEAP